MDVSTRFRLANDAIAARARAYDVASAPFLCECRDRRCFGVVPLTLEEFETTRAEARAVVIEGHAANDEVP